MLHATEMQTHTQTGHEKKKIENKITKQHKSKIVEKKKQQFSAVS